jgi:hypothetical protein
MGRPLQLFSLGSTRGRLTDGRLLKEGKGAPDPVGPLQKQSVADWGYLGLIFLGEE